MAENMPRPDAQIKIDNAKTLSYIQYLTSREQTNWGNEWDIRDCAVQENEKNRLPPQRQAEKER
ncbi:MAG: hypothetical protein ACE5IY_20235 [bacterium]